MALLLAASLLTQAYVRHRSDLLVVALAVILTLLTSAPVRLPEQ